MTMRKISFDSMAWESPMPGLRFRALRQGGQQLRMVEYTPEMELHWCEKGHVGLVLEGEFEIEFPDETLRYGAGEGVFIPSGHADRHRGRALTDRVKVVFVEGG